VDYKKTYLAILIIDILLLVLLGAFSLRFLTSQIRKGKEVDPEILAQYKIVLEVDQFLNLVKKLEKHNNP